MSEVIDLAARRLAKQQTVIAQPLSMREHVARQQPGWFAEIFDQQLETNLLRVVNLVGDTAIKALIDSKIIVKTRTIAASSEEIPFGPADVTRFSKTVLQADVSNSFPLLFERYTGAKTADRAAKYAALYMTGLVAGAVGIKTYIPSSDRFLNKELWSQTRLGEHRELRSMHRFAGGLVAEVFHETFPSSTQVPKNISLGMYEAGLRNPFTAREMKRAITPVY